MIDKSTPFTVVNNKTKCNYCTKEWEVGNSLTNIEAHMQAHVKHGDELVINKDPNSMTFDEKKSFFDKVYADTNLKEKLSDKAITRTLSEIADDQGQVREIYVPELNSKIKWKPMTGEDYLALAKIEDQSQMKVEYVYHHLKRVDKTCTLKSLSKMPAHVVECVFLAIQGDMDFLAMKPLQDALRSMDS